MDNSQSEVAVSLPVVSSPSFDNMKRLLFIPIIFLFTHGISAQDTSQSDSVLNSVLDDMLFQEDIDLYELFDGKTNYHFLYFGTTYNAKTFYAGREFIDPLTELPINNASFQLYYFITNGLYFGSSIAWYNRMDPSVRTSIFTLGYSNGLKNHDFLRYRASYNRYIYLNMGTDYEPGFSNNLALGFTLKHKKVGMRFDYSLLAGKDSLDHHFSVDLYAKIKLLSLGGYDKIQIKPEISAFFAREEYGIDIHSGSADDFFYEPDYVYYTKFGLLNTQLILPLSISYKNLDFEVAYYYNLPRTYEPDYYYPNAGYLQFSLGYILKIN